MAASGQADQRAAEPTPAQQPGSVIEWITSDRPIEYPFAVAYMEQRVSDILDGRAPEAIWLLEHPPLYTAGTSARDSDLLDPGRFPVYRAGRGGRFTYHGPGQRVGYVMLDLKRRGADIRDFVCRVEGWVIEALALLGVRGERRAGRVGIWVERAGGGEAKIAAVGLRVRRWVTFHGIALNVDPDLSHFDGIVPCGLQDYEVTSLAELGVRCEMDDVDVALRRAFASAFGRLDLAPAAADTALVLDPDALQS